MQIVDDDGHEKPRARFDAQGRLANADECVGEIVNTAGVGPFEGYYNNPEATERTTRFGWYWSGDLGYVDADGYLFFAGRTADWIRVDGENFPAGPIEDALARHPDVVLGAVYGVPDEQAGDQVMASLVLRDGTSFDPSAFARWLDGLDDIGPKWRPRYVRLLREPPTTGTNKIVKRTLVHQKWRTRSRRRRRGLRRGAAARTPTAGSPPPTSTHSRRRSSAPVASGSGTSDGALMDLSFTAEERAFADEIRTWLATHLDLPPAFESLDDEIAWGRAWQAKLAADRWIGIHWPAEYGGRGASPVQVAIYNMEYARSRALQPVNRVGINLAGPTLLTHGTEAQKQQWLPRILDASEIWCQLFSEPEAGSDLAVAAHPCGTGRPAAGGSRVRRSGRATRSSPGGGSGSSAPTPKRRSTTGSRSWWSTWKRRASRSGRWCRSPVKPSSTRSSSTGCSCPRTHLVGGLHEGWAVASTTLAHERGTAFPFKEQVVHEVFLDELYALAAARRHARRRGDLRCARAVLRRAARVAAPQLADVVSSRRAASSPDRSRAW